jgi:V/A-type H+-transporting ATPase subunit D
MKGTSGTRMEMLALQAQLKLAEQGQDLLEQKRIALMEEMLRLADAVMESSEHLEQVATEAQRTLARANAVAGTEAVRSAALASCLGLPLQIRSTNVVGVKVPVIERTGAARSTLDRGYSVIGTSLTIDEAASVFEAEVEVIVQLAETELRLRRLAEALRRTSRRLNALRHYLIPGLKAEIVRIRDCLDERERSDHFRLKLAKRLMERKRAAQDRLAQSD